MLVDFQASMPFLILALAVLAFFGNSLPLLIGLMGLYGWERYARIARGLAISANAQGYAAAVRQLGATPSRIYLRHILPNIASTLIVSMTLVFPEVILLESGLSFLGLGVQPPMTSLGNMVGYGREYLTRAPWIMLAPADDHRADDAGGLHDRRLAARPARSDPGIARSHYRNCRHATPNRRHRDLRRSPAGFRLGRNHAEHGAAYAGPAPGSPIIAASFRRRRAHRPHRSRPAAGRSRTACAATPWRCRSTAATRFTMPASPNSTTPIAIISADCCCGVRWPSGPLRSTAPCCARTSRPAPLTFTMLRGTASCTIAN